MKLIAVVQKILPERLGQSDIALATESVSSRRASSEIFHFLSKRFSRRAQLRLVMMSGGVKLITLACSPSGNRTNPRAAFV